MVTYRKFTAPGDRPVNEDCVYTCENGGQLLCVVCDGLGGHGRGDEASRLVTQEIVRVFRESDDFMAHMDEAFESAQKLLLEEQVRQCAKFEMKTTATILVLSQTECRWGHIGDSRIYLFRNGRYKSRTLDHSVPQMLVLAKNIKEKDIRNHPDRNKLLRVIGSEWGSKSYEISERTEFKPGMAFLMCTDGFWELIEEKDMAALLRRSNTAGDWVDAMLQVVRQNGKGKNMDNYSAVAVKY